MDTIARKYSRARAIEDATELNVADALGNSGSSLAPVIAAPPISQVSDATEKTEISY
jgi:hypothetical protein